MAKDMPARSRKQTRAPRTMARAKAAELYAILAEADPAPRTELEYANPFTLLVAVVLSAQATDAGVNKATRGLFAEADTPEAMLSLGEAGVAGHIRTIGLWRNKAKNVIALSQRLVEAFDGEVPRRREDLTRSAGRGAQDGQCRAQRGVRRRDFRGRHAYFPGRQPHRARAGQDA